MAPKRPIVRPPPLAAWLAVRRIAPEDREFALGDLDEDFQAIASRSPAAARRWYWREVLRGVLTHRRRQVIPNRTGGGLMTGLTQDIRFALRWLRRAPAFTLAAAGTLALGIGATTALFSVVYAVLFARLPFPNAARLVAASNGESRATSTPISYPQFLEWRDAGVFDTTAAYFSWKPAFTGGGEPEVLSGLRVSASLFDVLGIQPDRGHAFDERDEPRAAAGVVLLSDGFWHRRFGGSGDAIGRTIRLSDVPFTVVGVMPPGFRLQPGGRAPDVIAPLRLNETVAPSSLHFMDAIALLRPGQTIAQARDALQTWERARYPSMTPAPTVFIESARTSITSDSAPVLWTLFGAVGVLLMIMCANLAHLLLARSTARRPEIAVRIAIGAGRGRIVRQLVTESLVLAAIGGALGLLLASAGISLLASSAIVRQAGAFALHVNLPVLAFATVASIAAGLLFGMAPALSAARASTRSAMGDATRVAGGRQRFRGIMVAAELAMTMVLLIGAGLLVRSFTNLLLADKGFDETHVLSFDVSLPDAKYPTPVVQTQFLQQTLERLAQIPGVTSSALISERPLGGSSTNGGLTIPGRTFPPGEGPHGEKRIASPEYFDTLGIRLIAGRTFTVHDTTASPGVMVVSESFARRYFTDGKAVGERVGFDWDMDGTQEIVGVVADVKHNGLDDAPLPMVYVSYLQRPISYAGIVIKAAGDPATLASAVRDVMRSLDPDRPIEHLETMSASVAGAMATRQFVVVVAMFFSLLAALLALTGVYGVVSYDVRQRTREFGIRLALGARPGDLVRLAVGQGIWPVVIGLAAGVTAAVPLSRLVRATLFGVTATDVPTYVAVAAGLAAIAGVACYVPARKVLGLDAANVMRTE